MWRETTIMPLQNFHAISVGIPLPLWDKNKGNIRAASAALVRAAEGPHQVEVSLTTGLATAYGSYKTNLAAVEYYRRHILPDQVRYYRGVFERRKIDPSARVRRPGPAQQTLVTDVTAYLGILGSLWSSVVGVADFLQTDDLYQLGKPLELPELPDFDAAACLAVSPPSDDAPAGRGPAHADPGPARRPAAACHFDSIPGCDPSDREAPRDGGI